MSGIKNWWPVYRLALWVFMVPLLVFGWLQRPLPLLLTVIGVLFVAVVTSSNVVAARRCIAARRGAA